MQPKARFLEGPLRRFLERKKLQPLNIGPVLHGVVLKWARTDSTRSVTGSVPFRPCLWGTPCNNEAPGFQGSVDRECQPAVSRDLVKKVSGHSGDTPEPGAIR